MRFFVPLVAFAFTLLSSASNADKTCSDSCPLPRHILFVGDSEAGAAYSRIDAVRGRDTVYLEYKVSSRIEYWTETRFLFALQRHPDIDAVVIFLGTNDYAATKLPDVDPILDDVRSQGDPRFFKRLDCVWVGPTSVQGRSWPISDALKKKVQPTCKFVDTQLLGIPLRDGIHPTWGGILKWLTAIWKVL